MNRSKTVSGAFSLLIALLIFGASFAYAAPDYSVPPEIDSGAAVLMDAGTGNIIFSKDKDQKLAMASLTKMMTALVTLEDRQLDDVVVIDNNTDTPSSARFVMKKGEKYTIDQLLYALLVVSSNEGATALAYEDGGVDAFLEKMNKKAADLGAKNTHFANPHGLDQKEHYSTAADMAIIARTAMKNREFRRYVGTKEYDMAATDLQKARKLTNTNRLYHDKEKVYGENRAVVYADVVGVKTGYTDAAGTCLAAAVNRDGVELISIVLHGDTNKTYQDTIALMEYGFHNFKAATVFTKNKEQDRLPVLGGREKFVDGLAAETVKATIPMAATAEDIEIRIKPADEIRAPVTKGAVVGKAEAWLKDEKIAETDLRAAADVKKSIFSASGGFISILLRVVLIAAAILFLIIVIALIRANRLRHRGAFSRRSQNDFTSREVKRIKRLR